MTGRVVEVSAPVSARTLRLVTEHGGLRSFVNTTGRAWAVSDPTRTHGVFGALTALSSNASLRSCPVGDAEDAA